MINMQFSHLPLIGGPPKRLLSTRNPLPRQEIKTYHVFYFYIPLSTPNMLPLLSLRAQTTQPLTSIIIQFLGIHFYCKCRLLKDQLHKYLYITVYVSRIWKANKKGNNWKGKTLWRLRSLLPYIWRTQRVFLGIF